jgi:hypothetical protein
MAQGKATAQLSALIKDRLAAMRAIHREAAERTIEVMQTPIGAGGSLRVDTGFLRASLQVALGAANFTIRSKPDGGGTYTYNPGEAVIAISTAELTDTISAAYTANYARPREYKDRWVALAAQRYPQVVGEVVGEVNRGVHA